MSCIFDYIIDPETGKKVNIYGKVGTTVLYHYINQFGGKCTICGAPNVNKKTCPGNDKATNPKPDMHNYWSKREPGKPASVDSHKKRFEKSDKS